MPAFFTHKLTGDYILKNMKNPAVKAVITNNQKAFYSGTQGGDYLYFYKYYCMFINAKLKMLGYAMHHMRPQVFFVKSAQYIKDKNSDVLKSFIYGYITHYCLDKILHPLIGKNSKGYSSHLRLEHDLDSMYAHNKYNLDLTTINRGDIVDNTYDDSGEIDDFITFISNDVYSGFGAKENPYTLTYKYYGKINKTFYNMSKKKRALYKFLTIFMQIDVFSMLYKKVEEIENKSAYEKYYVLIDKAIEESYKFIYLLDSYFKGEKDITCVASAFYNVNFGGRVVVPHEEKKAFRKAYKKCKIKH